MDGIEDTQGTLIPFRNGEEWCPKINVETGVILDWPGEIATVFYKICDDGEYFLGTTQEKQYAWKGYYVPLFLSVNYKDVDYISLTINEDGSIQDWPSFKFDPAEWRSLVQQ